MTTHDCDTIYVRKRRRFSVRTSSRCEIKQNSEKSLGSRSRKGAEVWLVRKNKLTFLLLSA